MSTKISKTPDWADAIRFAEDQIEQAKRRIQMLEGSVRVFRERQAAGDPYPGSARWMRQQKTGSHRGVAP
jgi:hypothetical protein